MAENKVAAAVSKLEEDGLTVPACKKFIKMYSKVSIFLNKDLNLLINVCKKKKLRCTFL